MGKNVVVIGTQWGDEGKGKIVDWLTEQAAGVVRFQGGHNAGHTLVIGGTQDRAAPDSVGHPAPQVAVLHRQRRRACRPRRCCRRSASSKRPGVEVRSRLAISPACPLVLPYHVALDQARENARRASKIGTTGRGIGPAYEDKVARRAIRVQDLLDPDRFADEARASCSTTTTSC